MKAEWMPVYSRLFILLLWWGSPTVCLLTCLRHWALEGCILNHSWFENLTMTHHYLRFILIPFTQPSESSWAKCNEVKCSRRISLHRVTFPPIHSVWLGCNTAWFLCWVKRVVIKEFLLLIPSPNSVPTFRGILKQLFYSFY